MRALIKFLPVVALSLGLSAAASAQPGTYRNHIYDSGNGANNHIQASNFGGGYGYGGFPGGGFGGGGCAHGGFPGGGFGGGFAGHPGYGPGPILGGRLRALIPNVNVNVIANSGNGIGNSINAGNFGGGGGFGPGGYNFNHISNSGNGAYNRIRAFNR